MSVEPTDRFDEEQVKSLIARAIELDTREHTSSTEEVRAIASELGISADAVDAALREQREPPSPVVPRLFNRPLAGVILGGAAVGIATGGLSALVHTLAFLSSFGLVAGGFWGSGALLVLEGRNVTVRSFMRRNFLLWASLAAGGLLSLSLVESFPALSIVIVSLRGWVSSSILGSAAVIAIRNAAAPAGAVAPPTRGETTVRSFHVRLLHAVRRVADRVARVVRRETIGVFRLSTSAGRVSQQT